MPLPHVTPLSSESSPISEPCPSPTTTMTSTTLATYSPHLVIAMPESQQQQQQQSTPNDNEEEVHSFFMTRPRRFRRIENDGHGLFLPVEVHNAAEEQDRENPGLRDPQGRQDEQGERRIWGNITYPEAACMVAAWFIFFGVWILQQRNFF